MCSSPERYLIPTTVILVHDSSNRKSFMHLSRWVSELNEAIGLWAALNGVNIGTLLFAKKRLA